MTATISRRPVSVTTDHGGTAFVLRPIGTVRGADA